MSNLAKQHGKITVPAVPPGIDFVDFPRDQLNFSLNPNRLRKITRGRNKPISPIAPRLLKDFPADGSAPDFRPEISGSRFNDGKTDPLQRPPGRLDHLKSLPFFHRQGHGHTLRHGRKLPEIFKLKI